jgi:hypothetical protein
MMTFLIYSPSSSVDPGITSRDEYEKVARDIRYSFYQEVIKEANTGAFRVIVVFVIVIWIC